MKSNFDILYGEGISKESEIIELGVKQSLIDKAGAWYSCNGDRIGQGKENVRQYLKDNPALSAQLEAEIKDALFPKTVTKTEDNTVESE